MEYEIKELTVCLFNYMIKYVHTEGEGLHSCLFMGTDRNKNEYTSGYSLLNSFFFVLNSLDF